MPGKCISGSVKELNSYFQMEYILSFLMGLNDSFAQIRSHLLLLDPVPLISKVFSLILQEESQRSISSQHISGGVDTNNGMPWWLEMTMSINFNVKIGRQTATRKVTLKILLVIKIKIKIGRSTQAAFPWFDKCYKLHGYPLVYKHKQRHHKANVNQTSISSDHNTKSIYWEYHSRS